MWDCTRNLRTYELDLGRRFGPAEQQAVLRSLISKRGIRRAGFSSQDSRRLMVEYDADMIGPLGLREFLLTGGSIPVPMRPGPAAISGRGRSGSDLHAA